MKPFFFIICFFCFCSVTSASEIPVKEIKGQEVWSGEIIINGVVAVRKSGRLKIEPGTKVMFVAHDYDGDGIGDGELYVEGEIECQGTKELPVLFTVYFDNVSPSKWKYVMVNHGKKAVFDFTIFEGAFSGLQVHFTNAVVKNSVFRNNVDGFRFSTANVFVTNSSMYRNKYGIRYEERDSKGIICGNDIYDNEVGIFPVTKCKGRVNFVVNNIWRNEYNIKLGDEQKDSLSFRNNYLGSDREEEVKKSIYDKKYDKNLPIVNFKPFLKKRVQAGEKRCSKNPF